MDSPRGETWSGLFPDPPIPDLDDEGWLVPPWIKYPNIARRSMGWRMGMGEWYRDKFREWWSQQPNDLRLKYKTKYVEPDDWNGFL
jgi:hypothetical protein